ncbi:MAG: hypothetical protein ACXADH_15785 [Candidatus Kariarchaeaceae archaeon]|jgi:hypothetical protein
MDPKYYIGKGGMGSLIIDDIEFVVSKEQLISNFGTPDDPLGRNALMEAGIYSIDESVSKEYLNILTRYGRVNVNNDFYSECSIK